MIMSNPILLKSLW